MPYWGGVSACRSMLALGLVLAALAGCDSEAATSRVPSRPARRRRRARRGRRRTAAAAAAGAAAAARPLRRPDLPRGPARRPAPLRRAARGHDRDRARAPAARPALPRHLRQRVDGWRGRAAVDGLRARLQRSGRFFVYYTDTTGYLQIDQFRRSGDPDRADPGSRRSVIRVPHSRSNHKGGQLQFGPDGMLYAGFGDGGVGRRSGRERPEPGPHARQADPDRPAPRAAATTFPPRTRSRGRAAPARRSTPTGCATRTASRSTAAAATSRSATSARTPSRRSTTCPAAAAAASRAAATTSAGTCSRAATASRAARRPGTCAPVITHRQDAGWCSIIGGYVIRDRSLRGSRYSGRYVYGDLCRPELRLALPQARARAHPRRPACVCRTSFPSGRTVRGGSTRCRSTGWSIG